MLPTQADLAALLVNARRIRIVDAGTGNNELTQFTSRGQGTLATLLETADVTEIESFKAAFRIVTPAESVQCMCRGWPAIEITTGERTLLFGMHHGQSVRFGGWSADAPFENGRQLAEWMAKRGVGEPLAEIEKLAQRANQTALDLDRWKLAMPPCLGAFGAQLFAFLWPADEAAMLERARGALEAAEPDVAERVLVLLRWYGSGAGPWTGYPSYEDVPAKLLVMIAADVWAIAEAARTPAALVGTARYAAFARWRSKVREPIALSEALRERLRGQMASHPIADCRSRFESAVT